MNSLTRSFAFAAVTLIAYSPFSSAETIGLPGIPEAGDPNFINDAQVSLFDLGSGSNYLLAASNPGAPLTFNYSSRDISVSSNASHPANFLLTALFSSDGSYIPNTGTVSISGEIPYPFENLPGVYISGDLLTAKLEDFVFDADTLGFSTNMISGFGTLFGTHESVYLSATGLGSALGFGSGSMLATASPITASVITTVPIPGAGWLIGTAFGVFTLSRRNRLNFESAC